jgi:hypothetical protein
VLRIGEGVAPPRWPRILDGHAGRSGAFQHVPLLIRRVGESGCQWSAGPHQLHTRRYSDQVDQWLARQVAVQNADH